jgi:hypothetical protein
MGRKENALMRFRTHNIELRRGQQHLAVRQKAVDGQVRFIGLLDGIECVSAASRETAINSLIRRVVHQSPI